MSCFSKHDFPSTRYTDEIETRLHFQVMGARGCVRNWSFVDPTRRKASIIRCCTHLIYLVCTFIIAIMEEYSNW